MGHIREYTTRKGEKRYEASIKRRNKKTSKTFCTYEEAEEYVEEEEESKRRAEQEDPGMTIKEIAAKLGVDPATVRHHLRKAADKLRKNKELQEAYQWALRSSEKAVGRQP